MATAGSGENQIYIVSNDALTKSSTTGTAWFAVPGGPERFNSQIARGLATFSIGNDNKPKFTGPDPVRALASCGEPELYAKQTYTLHVPTGTSQKDIDKLLEFAGGDPARSDVVKITHVSIGGELYHVKPGKNDRSVLGSKVTSDLSVKATLVLSGFHEVQKNQSDNSSVQPINFQQQAVAKKSNFFSRLLSRTLQSTAPLSVAEAQNINPNSIAKNIGQSAVFSIDKDNIPKFTAENNPIVALNNCDNKTLKKLKYDLVLPSGTKQDVGNELLAKVEGKNPISNVIIGTEKYNVKQDEHGRVALGDPVKGKHGLKRKI